MHSAKHPNGDDHDHASHVRPSAGSAGNHAHSHAHGAGMLRAGERHRGRLLGAFAIIAIFFVVEAIAGWWTNSLALLSDAGHMFTDVLGLGMALAAIHLASKFESRANASRSAHTFGLYRLEVLAAFINSLLLFGVAIWVLIEAVRRLTSEPEVLGVQMLIVAILGLLANLAAFALLRSGSKESLNVEAAYLEVLADTVGSFGVIVAAILMKAFGWTWVDPIIGAAIALWILPRSWRLGASAVRILLQAAPRDVNLDHVAADLAAIRGVVAVHDLHVWTLTSEMEAASAHLVTTTGADSTGVLVSARQVMAERYGIEHATFQVEPDTHTDCGDVTW